MKTANIKSKQPTLLLVDDNEELRKAMGAMLGASKFLVSTAEPNRYQRPPSPTVRFVSPKGYSVLMDH